MTPATDILQKLQPLSLNVAIWLRQDRSERGASMVEYALLLALIAIAVIGAVGAFGGGLGQEFSDIGSTVEDNLDNRP